jgi:hypothetical protein
MPIARIRSFDPEAIAFLAAQLAQSGYTLQFVRPDETVLEVADLELTVVRRDLDEALRTAEDEAERLGVDVTVMPGAIPIPEPVVTVAPVAPAAEPLSHVADIPEPAAFPGEVEMPAARQVPAIAAREINRDVAREKPTWVQVTQDSSEKTAHLLGRGLGKAIDGFEVLSDSVERGVAKCKDDLVEIGGSTATRISDWKMRLHTAQARRKASQAEMFVPPVAKARNLYRRPKPLWLRERIYKGAVVAAVLAVAAIIGWTLAGYAGPANPVGKGTGLSTVQEQVPFGPASASAPTAAIVPARLSEKANSKPAATQAASHARVARHDDDQEVIVRHFDRKPAAVQAKSKSHDIVTRDGVKIISEE